MKTIDRSNNNDWSLQTVSSLEKITDRSNSNRERSIASKSRTNSSPRDKTSSCLEEFHRSPVWNVPWFDYFWLNWERRRTWIQWRPPSHSTVQDNQSPENIPTTPMNLIDYYIGYQLYFRQNRGKQPNRYSPNIGKMSKYPIANYVSTQRLH